MSCARWASFAGLVLVQLLGCPAEDTTSSAGAGGTGGEAGAPSGGTGAGGSGGAASGGGGSGGAGGSGGGSGGGPTPVPDPELCAKLEVPAMPTTGFATEEEAAASALEPGVVYDIAVPAADLVYVAFPTVSEHTTFGAYVPPVSG